jgi:3-hydroxyacyl-CoA dehydrogenase
MILDFAAKSGNKRADDHRTGDPGALRLSDDQRGRARSSKRKIAIRASDIDTVWINGYGWPVYRGGPMFYGDTGRPGEGCCQAEGTGTAPGT